MGSWRGWRRGLSSLSEVLSQVASEASSRKQLVQEVKALGAHISRPGWDPNARAGAPISHLTPDHVVELIKALRHDPIWALRVYIWATRQPGYSHTALTRARLVALWPDSPLLEPFLNTLEHPSPAPSLEHFLLLIKGYGWAKMPDLAMATLGRMASAGCPPEVYHFNSLLFILVECNRLKNIRELFKHMQESGVLPNNSTYALRVRGYCVAGQFDEALKAFRQMLKAGFPPDIKTFGYLIDAMCKANKPHLLYVIPSVMHEHRCIPNAAICHEMLEGLCRNKCVKYAEKLVKLIALRNVEPSATVCNILVKGLCRERKLHVALVEVSNMLKRGYLPEADVFDLLLILLLKEGRLGNIFRLMDKLMSKGFLPNVSTYELLIYGLSKCDDVGKAFDAWSILMQYKFPSVKAYRALVQGLCRSGRLVEAKEVFEATLHHGERGDAAAHDTLLFRLKQAGRVNDARECEDILNARRKANDDTVDIFEDLSLQSSDSEESEENSVDEDMDISTDDNLSEEDD